MALGYVKSSWIEPWVACSLEREGPWNPVRLPERKEVNLFRKLLASRTR